MVRAVLRACESPLTRPLLVLLLAVFCAGCERPAAPAPAEEPGARVTRALARGVNLSNWFTHREDPNITPRRWYPDAGDFQRLRGLGLGHVRVGLDPAWLADARGAPVGERLAELRSGVLQAQAAGLLVALSMQPLPEHKAALFTNTAARRRLLALWRALAGALADLPPALLLFEALNEPQTEDAAASRALMLELVTAIRAGAPRHAIAVAGHHFSDVPDLVQMAPLPDRNLIYAFHFYEPPNFTHQGAGWGWPLWIRFHGWPYPSSPEAVTPLLPSQAPEAREHLAWYGEQRWNRDKLAVTLDQATDWGRRHGVTLWCSEFGVYRYNAPNADRLRWLRDTRELFEARGIHWTLWDYTGHFGLVEGFQGQRRLDEPMARALGLSPP